MSRVIIWQWIVVGLLAVAGVAVGLSVMWQAGQPRTPEAIAEAYFRAGYRRDYGLAWNFISQADKAYKTRAQYLAENAVLTGSQPMLLERLAAWAEFTVISTVWTEDDHAIVATSVRAPDLEEPVLAQLLELAAAADPDTVLAQLEGLNRGNQIKYVEGEQAFGLVYADGHWGVVLHWEGAVTVHLTAAISPDLPWEFYPVQAEIQAMPGETVQVVYRVKNLADHPITGKARHEFESAPDGYRSYFETLQCFCFTEQTLAAGEEKDMPLIFRVDFTVPPEVTGFTNGYTFYPLESFPGDAPPTPAP